MLVCYEQIWRFYLVDPEERSKFDDLNGLQRASKKSYTKIKKEKFEKFVFAFLAELGNFHQKIIFQKILHGFLEDSLEAVEVDKFWPLFRIDQVKSSNLFIIT